MVSMQKQQDKENADVLSDQFASVFTSEPDRESPPAIADVPRKRYTEVGEQR